MLILPLLFHREPVQTIVVNGSTWILADNSSELHAPEGLGLIVSACILTGLFGLAFSIWYLSYRRK